MVVNRSDVLFTNKVVISKGLIAEKGELFFMYSYSNSIRIVKFLLTWLYREIVDISTGNQLLDV